MFVIESSVIYICINLHSFIYLLTNERSSTVTK